MDFDGVHTDGYVYVSQEGIEMVRCSRKDGLGLNLLAQNGIKLVVLSKETNPVVKMRCKKLQIECIFGIHNAQGKKELLQNFLLQKKFNPDEMVFIGDDLNDMEAIQFAGVGVTVADGHKSIKKIADLTLSSKGGEHALRELSELILEAKKIKISF